MIERERDVAISAKGVNLINLDPHSDVSPKCVLVLLLLVFKVSF